MSGPPVRPRSRELEIVRVLFDKHLLERAVNLAEARWEGSGEMVRLAYHWQDLSPAERRQQLEAIGPEQLARFRSLADLDPELATVLDTLEERGVIPGGQHVAHDPTDEAAGDELPDPYLESEPVVVEEDVTIDVAAGTDVRNEQRWSPDLSGPLDELATAASGIAGTRTGTLDREEVIQAEQQRRADAVRSGEELLQRVRARLDSTARRVTSNPIGSNSGAPTLPAHVPARMPGSAGAQSVSVSDDASAFTPPPDHWLRLLRDERVIVVEPGTVSPSDDQLVALANEFDLELSEFVIEAGSSRALFGGLKRSGTQVDVQVGPLPAALADRHLAVIHGRLFPRIEARMRSGMVDIPGTRATVRMNPDARVILIR